MSASVNLDVEIKSPIDRVWQALTDAATLSEWMLFQTTDFLPVVGHKFQFRMEPSPEWSVTVDCEVMIVEEPHRLAYSWVVAAQNHETTVTWTLTELAGGATRLQLEQSGFAVDAKQELGGALHGWKQMVAQLENLLAEAA